MAEKPVKPIEVWLLTGFLGSGKTTMLNSLLAGEYFAGKDTAIVINEFGKLGIDSHLIKEKKFPTYEINKGSIFCICTKTEFIKTFQLLKHNKPDTIIIEATGIAETSGIEQLLKEPVLDNTFKIRANICLADAGSLIQTAAFLKPAISQVQQADAIVINKKDLVNSQVLSETTIFSKELNPNALITTTEYGKVSTDFLNSLKHWQHTRNISECPPQEIPSIYIKTDSPLNKKLFFQTLERLKDYILRFKGNVSFEDGKLFIEVAGKQVIQDNFCDSLGAPTAFCVIGWKIDKQQLRDAFQNCIKHK